MGDPKVLLVGDFLLDSYVYGDALRISPEAPVPVLKVVERSYGCGGAASVAADLIELGAEAVCIGVIGQDDNGRQLKNMLTDLSADVSGLLALSDRPTISKQRLVGLAQHRHRQQLLRIDEEVTDELSAEQYEKIIAIYKERLSQVDAVCLQPCGAPTMSAANYNFRCRASSRAL